MSSGNTRINATLLERADPADFNNAQAVAAARDSAIVRALLNRQRVDYLTSPGGGERRSGSTSGTPLAAIVLEGLRVVVDSGDHATVIAGTVACYAPEVASASYDNPCLLIDDPGCSSTTQLPFTANASGTPRVDIVECQPAETLAASGLRDLYDLTAKRYVPSTVNKVYSTTLNYRIRTGTPGSGLPALAQGWLPIAVIIVPTLAGSFARCDVYDVRPLLEDMAPMYSANPRTYDRAYSVVLASSGAQTVAGKVDGDWKGWRIGGQITRNAPSSTADFGGEGESGHDFDVYNAANQDSNGFSVPHDSGSSGTISHLVAMFPGGLPRWVRYSEAGENRSPKGPRGILVITIMSPDINGYYAGGIALPEAAGGLSGPAVSLVPLLGQDCSTTPATPGFLVQHGRGKRHFVDSSSSNDGGSFPKSRVFTSEACNAGVYAWALYRGYKVAPVNALSMAARITSISPGGGASVFHRSLRTDGIYAMGLPCPGTLYAPGTVSDEFHTEIPFPVLSGSTTLTLTYSGTPSPASSTATATLVPTSWDLP